MKNKIKKEGEFGQELILNLYDCSPETIRSPKKLQEFVDRLCKLIKMKKYGRTLIPHFGHDNPITAGYSLVQLIETSSITGHFSELWNSAYLNVFSCKPFDADKAARFSQRFFGAQRMKKRVIPR
ncbi:MAG: S-adenosylmethionine decarboxylase [Patescibacteria group bacterium]